MFLASAKTHGRQIRLERELEGHMTADFRRTNPPFVEALWRKDRILFWTTFGVLLASAGAYLWGSHAPNGGFPSFSPDAPPEWGIVLAVLVLWVPSATFNVAGLASVLRFTSALQRREAGGTRRDAVRAERTEWYRGAVRGSVLWWSLVAALWAVLVALAA